MLDKVAGALGFMFLVCGLALCCALFVALTGFWCSLQNEAAFLAASVGRYGGYTTEADAALRQFVQDARLDGNRLDVSVTPGGGRIRWGTPVRVAVTYRYPLKLGRGDSRNTWLNLEVPVTGVGRSVSAYAPGAYSVTYTAPSY